MAETRKQKIDRQKGHAADRAFDPIRRAMDSGDVVMTPAPPVSSDRTALLDMFRAYSVLRHLGWREIEYCPKDGTVFDAIEAGSTGVHDCHYQGDWPNGHWWVHTDSDLYPSRPILFRLKEKL